MNRRNGTTPPLTNPADRKRTGWVFTLILPALIFFTAPLPALAMPDREIETAVDTRLMSDNAVEAHMIDVEVQNGIVTLTGTVNRLTASERAADIAMTVKGVRAVVNNIETVGGGRSDRQILKDLRRKLKIDPVADVDEIDVEVREARVFLTGEVDSWQEKKLVGLDARSVKGVRAVENQLAVKASARRPDDEIAAEIQQRLAWDVWIEDAGIDLHVDDGRVRLSGVVGSLAAKERAIEIAWISGVRSVNAEKLSVDWETHRRNLRARPQRRHTDEAVKEAVTSALNHDPRVSTEYIDVRVENGVVTLEGTVGVLSAANAARQDAENTAGVWMVKNLIKVRPALTPTYAPLLDTDIKVAERIRLVLALAPELDQQDIGVTVNNHLVMLDGRVDSEFARRRAAEVVSEVRGVATLVNNLEVLKDRSRVRREDWQIQNSIKSELYWSPLVDESRVNVLVDDGVAVLTGVVENLRARRAATANARNGGARRVKNRLKVLRGPDFLKP